MATLNANNQTLLDLAEQMGPGDKQIATVIELLSQFNPILMDAPAEECNQGTKHLTTVRTGLPGVTWRKLYQGVQPTKSTTAQVTDSVGMLEAWSEIDAKLVELAPDKAKYRMNESAAFLEAMANEMATGLFYHDTATDPEKFMGLSPRFNDLGAVNGGQIIDGGGTGTDNTSVWFIVWGTNTCHLLYPRGSKAGVQREDKGKQTKELSGSNANEVYDVFRDKFTWDIGLTVRDWRFISRVANLDVSLMEAGSVDVEDFMIDAYYQLQSRFENKGKLVIYCNTTVKKALHKLAKDQANVNLTLDNFEGKEIVRFLGAPIQECEALLNTEDRVV